MPITNCSASWVKVRTSTNTVPSAAASTTALAGAPERRCTRAMARGNSPSSAIAKKMRGAVIIEPFRVPNVLTATAAQRHPEQNERHERADLERGAQVLEHGAAMDAEVVDRRDRHDVARRQQLLGP